MADHQAHRHDRDQEPAPAAPRGNRPAEHARHATPSSLLASEQWQGNAAAADFLGLDSELAAAPAPAAPTPQAPVAQRSMVPPAPAQTFTHPMTPPPRAAQAPAESAMVESTWLDEMPDTQEEELEPEPETVELIEPAVLETAWTEAATKRGTPSWIGWVAGSVAACALAYGGIRWNAARHTNESAEVETAIVTPAPAPKPAVIAAPVEVMEMPPSTKVAEPNVDTLAHGAPEPMPAADPVATPSEREPVAMDTPNPQVGESPFTPDTRMPREPAVETLESSKWDEPTVEEYVPQYPIEPQGAPDTPNPVDSMPQVVPTPEPVAVAPEPRAQAPVQPPQPIATTPDHAAAAVASAPASSPPPLAPPIPGYTAAELAKAAAADAEWNALVNNLHASTSEPAHPPTPAWAQPGAAPTDPAHQTASIGGGIGPQANDPSTQHGVTPGQAGVGTSGPITEPVGPRIAQPNPVNEPAASAHRATVLAPEDVVVPKNSTQTGVRPAGAKDLATMWAGDTVPMEAIGNAVKMLTPNVGKVRVSLKTKELFEGRLYAMGEGCVWLDGPYGRMGLEGSRVDKVERVGGNDATPALGAKGSQGLTGLDRIRIKTPGGIFFGKVLSQDKDKTTLITDDGAKLTLDTKDIEYLGSTPKTTVVKKK